MAHRIERAAGKGGAAALLLLAALLSASGCAGARRATSDRPGDGLRHAEGRVVVSRGAPILLAEGDGRSLVALSPAATLSGLGGLQELRAGERVRYAWRREVAGVRMAEVLETDPPVTNEAQFTYTEGELAVAYEQGRAPVLVDARPAPEFRAGHLRGARSLPAGEDVAEVPSAPTDPEAPVVVYGAGPRDGAAHAVARRLLAAGHAEVKVLKGGVQEWLAADRALEVDAAHLRELLAGAPWIIVDARPRDRSAAAAPAEAVSVPPEAFRWQDFDGAIPLAPILFVGADAHDRAPLDLAERVRMLRSARKIKQAVRLLVLAGGFEAWAREGLPIERGTPPRTEVPYRPVARAEIPPAEFERLWQERGGGSATFLDVRRVGTSPEEFVVKIPLEELAVRLHELPRDRELLVFCTIGERSHVAAELLRANGLRARFLRAASAH